MAEKESTLQAAPFGLTAQRLLVASDIPAQDVTVGQEDENARQQPVQVPPTQMIKNEGNP